MIEVGNWHPAAGWHRAPVQLLLQGCNLCVCPGAPLAQTHLEGLRHSAAHGGDLLGSHQCCGLHAQVLVAHLNGGRRQAHPAGRRKGEQVSRGVIAPACGSCQLDANRRGGSH